MSTENKALAKRFYEEFVNKGNQGVLDELCAPEFIDHNLPGPGFPSGLEGVKQVFTMFRSAFPDIRITVEDQIAEGDKVVNRITVRGTHRGEFQGTPPTGKTVEIGAVDIFRIFAGKVTERWGEANFMAMMQQIGVVPVPG